MPPDERDPDRGSPGEPSGADRSADDDPAFDVDAYDSDGDGSLDTTVLTTVESVDLDGDGINDAALMTSESMTDLDGDGLPDVIETTKTMIHDKGGGELQVVQSTERFFVSHGDDLDRTTSLIEDNDDLDDLPDSREFVGIPDNVVIVIDDDHPSVQGESRAIVRGLQHVSVCVEDIEAADHFYIDQLGLTRIPRPDLGIPGSWLEAEGGVQVHLIELPGSTGPESNHMAFTVDDLDAVATILRDKGVDVPDPADNGAGKQVFLRDPSGNIVELNEPTHLR